MIAPNHEFQFNTKEIQPSLLSSDHHERYQIRILSTDASGPVYDDILSIRQHVYGYDRAAAIHDTDGYSELYCAYVQGVASGTMRVTRAVCGKLDCEEFYPQPLVETFRNQLGSASGFCILKNLDPSLRLARMLIEAAWIDELPRGYRVDVISANERGVRYYQRMGYKLIADSAFVHPTYGTPSYAMAFVADANGGTPLDHLFQHVTYGVTVEDLGQTVVFDESPRRRRRERQIVVA